jgi:hypothetical protein
LRNRAVLGLGNRWRVGDHIRLNIGYEHQQSFGGFLPDGTPAGKNLRDVIHTGADVLVGDTFRAATQLELRFDDGVRGDGIESLITDDPRGVGAGVFPDHGGTAPGSPLVLQPGEQVQVVGGIGADWKWNPDATVFGRLRVSNTSADDDSGDDGFETIARYAQGSLGAVYRPLTSDWLQLLVRYSYILDERELTASATTTESKSHVASFVPVVELPWRLRLSGKLALKTSQSAVTISSGDEIDNSSDAVLGLVRVGYRLLGNLDATVEYRHLLLFKPVGDESKSGALVELGYSIRRFVRLGIGYNLSRFSDDELGDLQRDSHGFFMRLTGHY